MLIAKILLFSEKVTLNFKIVKRTMKKSYLLFGLICCICLSGLILSCNESTAEEDLYGRIKGKVTDSDSKPLAGVSISTSPASTSTVTDKNGAFDLGRVFAKDYTINASKDEYASLSTPVKVQEDQEQIITIVLNDEDPNTKAPKEPNYLNPKDAAKNQKSEIELKWNNCKINKKDEIKYDVYLYAGAKDTEGKKVAENITDTIFTITDLTFETTYLWKVVARNKNMEITEGQLVRFTTENYPINEYFFVREENGNKDIYSWDLEKNHVVRLTEESGSDVYPSVSPNDQSIVYSSNQTGQYHLYKMNLHGKDKRKISTSPIASYHSNGGGFSWSPDGSKILYPNNSKLLRINNDGTGETIVARAPVNRHFKACHWSGTFNNASREKLVVLTQGELPYENEIYLLDPDGSNMNLLVSDLPGTLSNPRFSLDGTKVIFSIDTLYQDKHGRQLNAKICSINVDGTNWKRLTDKTKVDGTNDLQARFSQTGGNIIFLNVASDGDGTKRIFKMNVDGSNRKEIILNGEMPEWINL